MRRFFAMTLLASGLLGGRPAHAAWLPQSDQLGAYSSALAHLGSARLEEAEAGFRALLAADPACGMAQHGLALSMLRQGRTPEAIEALSAAAAEHPDRAELFVGLSTARFVAQDFGGARAAAEQAVALDVGSIDAHAVLHQVLLRQGDVPAVRADLELARQSLPDPVVACFEVQFAAETGGFASHRVEACRRAGTPDLVTAALSRVPGEGTDTERVGSMAGRAGAEVVVQVALALELAASGDRAGAEALLDTVLSAHPKRVDARLARGRLLADRGERSAARRDLEAAFAGDVWITVHRSGAMSGILRKSDELRLAASLQRGAGLLATLMVDAGEVPEAAALVAKAREELGDGAPLAAAGVRIAMGQGDAEGATAQLEVALSEWPGDPAVLDAASALVLARIGAPTAPVVAALGASTRWQHGHNLALGWLRAGDPAACLRVVQDVRTRLGSSLNGDVSVRLAHLGLRCAAEADDMAAARRLLIRAGEIPAIPAVTRFNLALLEQRDEHPAAAWRLIQDLVARPPADNPELARVVVGLGLRLHVSLERWTDATALVARPEIPPEDAMWLGSQLVKAEREGDALRVLTSACPQLEGDTLETCEALLARLDD
jgi:tetratricopeptide (TPR) repeat protein